MRHKLTLTSRIVAIAAALSLVAVESQAQSITLPLRQSKLDSTARDINFRVPLDSTVDARWLGGRAQLSRWDIDGNWLYFRFDTLNVIDDNAMPELPWWRISRDGRRVESVSAADAARVPAGVQYTRDGSRAIYMQGQRLVYWKRGSAPRVLAAAPGLLRGFPRWSRDQKDVRWIAENGLYSVDPESGFIRQLTSSFTARETPRVDATVAEMRRAQVELFDFVRRNRLIRDTSEARARRNRDARPVTTPIRQNEAIGQVEYSNAGWVAYTVRPRVQPTQTTYSDYVNDSGMVFQRRSRPKVGEPIARTRVMLVPADTLAIPDSVKAVAIDTSEFKKPALAIQILTTPDGKQLVAEYQSVDYKDRWLLLIDPATGKVARVLAHDHDPAWFGGPGHVGGRHIPSWLEWRPGTNELMYTSERTGFAHAYVVDVTTGNTRTITSGEWEIRGISLHRDGKQLWITSGIEHPNESHLYLVPVTGGTPQRVDRTGEGVANILRSPDDAVLAFTYSTPTRLADIYLQPVQGKSGPLQVTRGGTDAFWRIAWPEQQYIRFNDDKGKPVYARVFKPLTQHASRPAVLEIHGAGYTQGVWKRFGGSSAHGGMLYAQHLAAKGATYVVLDYRGSAGYGRDYRTDVYRTMGDRDVASAVSLIPVLARDFNVNPQRIGLFGCSYGGFYTLMALFKHPGTFRAGVAQCSVTDWAHYNHSYTARILNGSPADDSAAYRMSSPIYHAEGLRDRLLLQHGLIDGNVQYQDAVRLVQRLMELGKDFEFVTYPVDQHGWSTIWARRDSQRRMQKLFDDALFDGTAVRQSN